MLDLYSLKKRWINALRSGKYRQGMEALYDGGENSYCCLGVLLTITPEEELQSGGYEFKRGSSGGYLLEYEEKSQRFLSTDREEFTSRLQTFYGMSNEFHTTLINMNDNERASFDDIADFIESSVEEMRPA